MHDPVRPLPFPASVDAPSVVVWRGRLRQIHNLVLALMVGRLRNTSSTIYRPANWPIYPTFPMHSRTLTDRDSNSRNSFE
jgi:hypothetical protein